MKLTLKKISQEKETLNTLKSIDRTLKHIEQILSEPKPDYEKMKLPSAFASLSQTANCDKAQGLP